MNISTEPQQTLIQFANSMIYLMLARFVLNDVPHMVGLYHRLEQRSIILYHPPGAEEEIPLGDRLILVEKGIII